MATGRHRTRLSGPRLGAIVAVLLALVALPLVAVFTNTSEASAAGSYNNAAIADKALSYVNRPIGQACRDAGNDRADGECRSFVNCIIWMASGRTQNTGTGWPDYFSGFAKYGQRISDVNQLSKGDVVQQGGRDSSPHLHTYIIVSRVSGNVFNVVDSNSDYKHRVLGGAGHNRSVALSNDVRAYRLGAVRGTTPTPQPNPTPTPAAPTFGVMNTAEQPPDGVYFRNSPRTADAIRVAGIGIYRNEQVRLRCYGWGESVGAHANRLWYQVNNLSRPSAAGRTNAGWLNAHYINDGKPANVIDAGVPAC